MTRIVDVSDRCRWCGRLAQFCEDPTGHEILHAQSETTWRQRAALPMARALLTPDAEVRDA